MAVSQCDGPARPAPHPVRSIGIALAILIALFLAGYTVAGYFSGMSVAGAAVWAVVLMLIYGPPVLLCSGLIALAIRGRLPRVAFAAGATAAIIATCLVFGPAGPLVAAVAFIGAGTTILLAIVPPRARRQEPGTGPKRPPN